VIAVEGVLGIVQAIYGFTQTGSFGGSNGDFVAGTIHPFPEAQLAFDNPAYAVNLSAMLLVCLAFPRALTARRKVCLVLGVAALLLASVVHALVFLIAAVVFAAVWTWRRAAQRPRQRQGAALVVLIAVLGFVGVRRNVDTIGAYIATAIDFEAVSVPRAILLGRVLFELPDDVPLQPLVGVGPGQFSSRASLIASGMYLGGPNAPKAVPFVTPASTHLADDYCISLLVAYSEIDDGSIGSSQQPFFSVLSIYTETGLVGLGLVLWLVGRVAWRARDRVKVHPELHPLGLAFVAGTGFFVLLGLQDNYWEVPQAIFVGALLFKLLYANLVAEPAEPSAGLEP
jgi:hypothetical protein